MREKLIALIGNTYVAIPPQIYRAVVDDTAAAVIADRLIANGVVAREKGEWEYHRKQGIAVCSSCSFERKVDDNFGRAVACPNCGADMTGGDRRV